MMIPPPQQFLEANAPSASPRRWLWVSVGLALFIIAVYVTMFSVASQFKKPVAASVDAVDDAAIEKIELLVINRPDGAADFSAGKTDTVTVPASEAPALLDTLRKANPVTTARGIWLGKLMIHFKDGRKLEILLYSVRESGPGPMRFKIEEFQYEVASITPFLNAVDAIDVKLKTKK